MTLLGTVIAASWLLALAGTVVNLALFPRLRAADGRRRPAVSVVIPARNEERAIETTVRAMLAQEGIDLQLIVVDDRSTDSTRAILGSFSDGRLTVVDGVETPDGWLGKPWAIEQGARLAAGELLLIADADIVYRQGAVAAAAAYIEDAGVDCVTLFPHFEMKGPWEVAAVTQLSMTVLAIIPVWLANRTGTPHLGVGGGPGALVRREAFTAAGGYGIVRDAVVDDVGFVRQLRARGFRTHIVAADDFVSVRMYHGLRETVEGFTKNAFTAFGGTYGSAVIFLTLLLLFHLAPFGLALAGNIQGIVSVALITMVRVLVFARFRYPLLWAVLLHPVTTLIWMWIVVRSTWKTGVRRQLHWRGREARAWSRFGR